MSPASKSDEQVSSSKRVYGGIKSAERSALRRKKIVDAAFNLFGTIGYQDTKIEQICAEAGVGIRSFYELFGTREKLFKQVYDDIAETAYDALKAAIENTADPEPTSLLRNGIRIYLHQMLDDKRRGKILSIESSRLDHFFGDHRNKTLKKFAMLSAAQLTKHSETSGFDTRTWSLVVAGGINELIIDALISSDPVDVDQLAQSASYMIEKTLR